LGVKGRKMGERVIKGKSGGAHGHQKNTDGGRQQATGQRKRFRKRERGSH